MINVAGRRAHARLVVAACARCSPTSSSSRGVMHHPDLGRRSRRCAVSCTRALRDSEKLEDSRRGARVRKLFNMPTDSSAARPRLKIAWNAPPARGRRRRARISTGALEVDRRFSMFFVENLFHEDESMAAVDSLFSDEPARARGASFKKVADAARAAAACARDGGRGVAVQVPPRGIAAGRRRRRRATRSATELSPDATCSAPHVVSMRSESSRGDLQSSMGGGAARRDHLGHVLLQGAAEPDLDDAHHRGHGVRPVRRPRVPAAVRDVSSLCLWALSSSSAARRQPALVVRHAAAPGRSDEALFQFARSSGSRPRGATPAASSGSSARASSSSSTTRA